MGDTSRFVIPEECRAFGETNCDERQRVAKRFVEKFVENIAPAKSHDTDGAWTQSERTRFIDICPLGCVAWPGDARTRKGEFLVDFGWEEEKGGNRVLLACESEWGSATSWKTKWRPVELDFEKLLAVKAPFKVLIFSSDFERGGCDGDPDTDFSIGYAKQRLEASLRGYGHNFPGETYVFLDFPRTGLKGSNGVYRAFIWLAKKNGDTNASLDDLAEGELIRQPEI